MIEMKVMVNMSENVVSLVFILALRQAHVSSLLSSVCWNPDWHLLDVRVCVCVYADILTYDHCKELRVTKAALFVSGQIIAGSLWLVRPQGAELSV